MRVVGKIWVGYGVDTQNACKNKFKIYFKVFYMLTTKEIKIKITLRIHFTAVRMASIKKAIETKCW